MKKAKLFLVIFLLIIVCIVVFLFAGSYSEGFRAGTIIKLSSKGYVFKTYEGQLNLGMVLSDQPGGATVSNIWDFSVPGSRKETVEKLQDAMLSGKRVKVHYKEKFFVMPWLGDTKYMVYDVEE